MRKAAIKRNPQKQQSTAIVRVAGPTHGWYSLENIVTQPDQTAVYMENFYPDPFSVRVRRGHKLHAYDLIGPVRSIIPWNGLNGTERLFAAALSRMWDVTDEGKAKVAGINITPGPGAEEFVWCAITVAGGPYTVAANQTDIPFIFDGKEWNRMMLEDKSGALNPFSLDSPWAYRGRLFFIEADANRAWFLPPDSISGEVQPVDLGGIFSKGGTLIAGGAWSVDTQVGPQERCVFISSNGEVAIYSGDNPADPEMWALEGTVRIASPLARRCTVRVGGDLYILTTDGIMPMSQATVIDVAQDRKVLLTSNINNAFVEAAEKTKNYPGWQIYAFTTGHTVYLNGPTTPKGNAEQYVMNTITGAWSRYTGLPATVWGSLNDKIYFGTSDGKIMRAEYGGADNGKPIVARFVTNFNMFGDGQALKFPKMVRPMVQSNADNPAMAIDVCLDYDVRVPSAPPVTYAVPEAYWDIDKWDEAKWGGLSSKRVQSGWRPLTAKPGRALAISFAVQVQSTNPDAPVFFSVLGFDLAFEAGNAL